MAESAGVVGSADAATGSSAVSVRVATWARCFRRASRASLSGSRAASSSRDCTASSRRLSARGAGVLSDTAGLAAGVCRLTGMGWATGSRSMETASGEGSIAAGARAAPASRAVRGLLAVAGALAGAAVVVPWGAAAGRDAAGVAGAETGCRGVAGAVAAVLVDGALVAPPSGAGLVSVADGRAAGRAPGVATGGYSGAGLYSGTHRVSIWRTSASPTGPGDSSQRLTEMSQLVPGGSMGRETRSLACGVGRVFSLSASSSSKSFSPGRRPVKAMGMSASV